MDEPTIVDIFKDYKGTYRPEEYRIEEVGREKIEDGEIEKDKK